MVYFSTLTIKIYQSCRYININIPFMDPMGLTFHHPRTALIDTPRKFNIDPEKWWWEDYFPIGTVTFQGLC